MPDINITVAHKVAVSDTQAIVCDNSDYTVHWALDEEWSAYDTKTMRTIYMDGTYEDKVFSGDTIALPVCTVPGVVQIGLFAGNLRTSRVAILRAAVRAVCGWRACRSDARRVRPTHGAHGAVGDVRLGAERSDREGLCAKPDALCITRKQSTCAGAGSNDRCAK